MRWKPKNPINVFPCPGDWRIKKRFAWLPVQTTLPNKVMIWLEFYKTNDMFSRTENGYKWVTNQIAPWEYWPNE